MGCDTRANLLGAVPESEIASFLAKHFHCRASYIHVGTHVYGKKSEIEDIKEDYDNSENWETVCGPIVMEFLGNHGNFNHDETRSLFYIRNNVNFHENLEYYEELGLGEMVRAQTTHISARTNDGNIAIVRAVVEEFGGWFTENDCGDEYVRIYGRRESVHASLRERRVDIVVEVETMMNTLCSPISHIRAFRTNVETGGLVDVFDVTMSECGGAQKLLALFFEWIGKMVNDVTSIEDIYLWNNGEMCADSLLRHACYSYGMVYPIDYHNSRDTHTLFDIVVSLKGYADENAYLREAQKVLQGEPDDGDAETYAKQVVGILHSTYELALGRK